MDSKIREYRRRMVQGEGSWAGYLHLMSRAGVSAGDALNSCISTSLSQHHRDIVKMHLDHEGSANFEGVGTDKSRPAIETVKVLMDTGLASRCLIIAPPVSVQQWLRIIENQLHPSIAVRLHGKDKLLIGSDRIKIFLASYNSLTARIRGSNLQGLTGPYSWGDVILEHDWDIVIADEAHRIKNPQAKCSVFTYALGDNATYKIAITGCPVLNRVEDIWGILRFFRPDVLGRDYRNFMLEHFSQVSSPPMPRYSWQPIPEQTDKLIQTLYTIPGIRWNRPTSQEIND